MYSPFLFLLHLENYWLSFINLRFFVIISTKKKDACLYIFFARKVDFPKMQLCNDIFD